ncbi:MAG: hypothetical protein HYV45_01455 [Candidatus Moranbacteria bacterium]|nr:hypothetical protein [Candidatus Moranbacteria bacterium]
MIHFPKEAFAFPREHPPKKEAKSHKKMMLGLRRLRGMQKVKEELSYWKT